MALTSLEPNAVVASRTTTPSHKGIVRTRLLHRLASLEEHRLGLIIGPAGSGKTTLLGHVASVAGDRPVAWYRAEAGDAPAPAAMAYLARALAAAAGRAANAWTSASDIARALESPPLDRVLLVVDDLHLLVGTQAEAVLERLVACLPQGAAALFASRCPPNFDVSRLRVSDALVELGPDELRFRSWEVEQLFTTYYREPMPPEELAELARRTEGWAAGLQLFHLATKGKPPGQRRRVLSGLGAGSKFLCEYLARNVLDDLDGDLRDFLVRTSVLGRLSGPLCDRLLGRKGSARILSELERRQLFTIAVDNDGGYRYHESLRTHLEGLLVEQLGEGSARAAYRRAGRLLEDAGALAEALRAYCRADDGVAADRLLGRDGQHLADEQGSWLLRLPPALVAADPWLQLASARRSLADGLPRAAAAIYQRAEHAFGRDQAGECCRRERASLGAWIEPRAVPGRDWLGLMRVATQRDPLSVLRQAAELEGATGHLVRAVAACLAGRPGASRAHAAACAGEPDASTTVFAVAGLVAAVAPALAGAELRHGDLDLWNERAELLATPWVTRASAALLDEDGVGVHDQTVLQDACAAAGDDWGVAMVPFLQAMALPAEKAAPSYRGAAEGFGRLGAGVLQAWATSGLAAVLARADHPDAVAVARQAEQLARAAAAHGALVLAHRAMARADPDHRRLFEELAASVAEAHGVEPVGLLAADHDVRAPPVEPRVAGPPVELRCFGRFSLAVAGRELDLGAVKPKARSTLRLLALHACRAVHRDYLIDALWPDADPVAATRSLQVAISSLRKAFESLAQPGFPDRSLPAVLREADAYRLWLPAGHTSDVASFEAGISRGRAARGHGDGAAAAAGFEDAVDAYVGELFPEEGPADWVVKARDRLRMDAADAAVAVAEMLLERGENEAAVAVCECGIRVDRYRDELWRLLVTASRRAGHLAAAARAERDYEAMLTDLGLQ